MLNYSTIFWREKAFGYVSAIAVLFVVLSTTAMLFYPGGTRRDPTIPGYAFFKNFFSDLGALHTFSGAQNFVSAALFFAALACAGLSLILFSISFPQLFQKPGAGRIPCGSGSFFGIIAGVCFVGIAFTPHDLLFYAHAQFSVWGFRFLLAAAFFWAMAIFRHPRYPKRYGWAFVVFGVLITGFIALPYVLWTAWGPPPYRAFGGGIGINATAQKIAVYASIGSVLLQSYGTRTLARTQFPCKSKDMEG